MEPEAEELEIEVREAQAPELAEGEDPAEREEGELLPFGAPERGVRWVVGYACLKQCLAHGQRSQEEEVGGVLLGEIWRGPRGRVTEAREALPARDTEAGLGHVTFSHETWAGIYQELEELGTGARIVGWYHSHPGFGVFFSEQDRFIQRNFFAGEGQVGVVVDPQRREVAACEAEGEDIRLLPGLWVFAEKEQAAAARQLLGQWRFRGPGARPLSWKERLARRVWGERG